MSQNSRDLILRHWQLANTRQWADFAALLAPDLNYGVPQTQEYIDSGHGYCEMFRTWPGEWKATIKHLVCDQTKAICVIDFDVGNEKMTGISIFELSNGLIVKVTDYWPEAYEPPERRTPYMKRRQGAA